MTDPLLSKIKLKTLEEIIAAARETIHRYRRRFVQRNLRPCALNCKGATMIGHKVIGCGNCGTNNPEACNQASKFVPLFTKEELGQQFADQLRDPEVLMREYQGVMVFFWVLGAFDRQTKQVDETIVEKVEQREKPKSIGAVAGDSRLNNFRHRDPNTGERDRPTTHGTPDATTNND